MQQQEPVSLASFAAVTETKRRVAIVGAGAAGICAARRLIEKFGVEQIDLTVFEQSSDVGGTWVYTDDADAPHTAMYEGMRTNIPSVDMEFFGFPFKPEDFQETNEFFEGSSFINHFDVLCYLRRFAEPINQFIQFNTKVASIERKQSDNDCWRFVVEKQAGFSLKIFTHFFDVVFIATGHYHCARLPRFVSRLTRIPWIHSHSYRKPKQYAGKRVAIVGAKLSGRDIVQQLVLDAKMVYLLHKRDPLQNDVLWVAAKDRMNRPNNYAECCYVVDATENSLVLADGKQLEQCDIDAVIFCTGYRYSLPFFKVDSPLVELPNDGDYVRPLWAHVAHVDHPNSLFFVGLNLVLAPFICFEYQCRFAIALMAGEIQTETLALSRANAAKEEERKIEELLASGQPLKNFLLLGKAQWEYYNWLDQLTTGGRCPYRPVLRKIYEFSTKLRSDDPEGYRNHRFTIIDDERFEVKTLSIH